MMKIFRLQFAWAILALVACGSQQDEAVVQSGLEIRPGEDFVDDLGRHWTAKGGITSWGYAADVENYVQSIESRPTYTGPRYMDMHLAELAENLRMVMRIGDQWWEQTNPDYDLARKILANAGAQKHYQSLPTIEREIVENLQGQIVFGGDNRQLRRDNTTFPFSALLATDPLLVNGVGCSGAMISDTAALTAAHCLMNAETGRFIAITNVSLGVDVQDMNPTPYGLYSTGAGGCVRIAVAKQWASGTDHPIYDYGIVDFANCSVTPQTPLGANPGLTTGVLGMRTTRDRELEDLPLISYGYPAVLCPSPGLNCMYASIWGTSSQEAGPKGGAELWHRTDTTGGQSGSALYHFDDGQRFVVGIHRGSWLDINHWMHNHGALMNYELMMIYQGGVNAFTSASRNPGSSHGNNNGGRPLAMQQR